MDFNTPISQLNRVGKTIAKRLEILGIRKVQDLLYYFPFRYEDYRQIVPIANLKDRELATVCAQVELIANKRSFRSRKIVTEALVSDASGSLRIVWFNQPFLTQQIKSGDIIYFSGKVKSDMLGPQLVSPAYEKYKKETTHTARLLPIYSATYGLTQKQIRFLMSQIIELADSIEEWLPKDILEKFDLVPLASALRGIHFPTDEHDLRLSTDRLKFDELFLVQMKAELSKKERSTLRAVPIAFKEEQIKTFVAALPFALTNTQKISAWEILQDISKPISMNRLVSGDVGSGKTVVAAIALYNVYLNGGQGALMAPTEILAQQHFASLTKLLSGAQVRLALLTGSLTKKEKIDIALGIKNGLVDIVVGTHALLTEGVEFKNLNLVVVDEQHRFGVEQRKLIKEKSLSKKGAISAHFLSMTATPIPRSLALMLYGDLDISIISELPPGRKKIITRLVEAANREKAYEFIRQQVRQGRQVFVVCPAIETSIDGEPNQSIVPLVNSAEKKSVMSEYEKLSKKVFPDLRVAYLHGKLKAKEKEQIMAKFKAGEFDLLVSTSVIEVGVDIPNASVMMIEDAQHFGLAQLHQFRGRVGRSSYQSYCLLFTSTFSRKAIERLKYFEQTTDGFKLAEKDLENRGPGEVYGTAQSGDMQLRLAKLSDQVLIKKCREAAKIVVEDLERHAAVLTKVRDWENQTHFE